MPQTFTPGSSVRCTIVKTPRTENRVQTIIRLMRKDAEISRALRNAQQQRRRQTEVYTRGGRDWYKRQRCGKIARVEEGATWTMHYTPDIANDLRSVENYIRVEQA